MAKIEKNVVMHGASGKLGNQIVFRQGKGGQMIVSVRPSTGRNFNPAQQAQQDAFRMAIAYAKSAKDEAIYIAKAQGTTRSSYNAAVADWFGKPEVLEIDTTDWRGASEEIIRVQAQDDTQVTKVHVQITDAAGTVLEQGDAVAANGLWWEYTTTTNVPSMTNAKVRATAHDLPGNKHMLLWQFN